MIKLHSVQDRFNQALHFIKTDQEILLDLVDPYLKLKSQKPNENIWVVGRSQRSSCC